MNKEKEESRILDYIEGSLDEDETKELIKDLNQSKALRKIYYENIIFDTLLENQIQGEKEFDVNTQVEIFKSPKRKNRNIIYWIAASVAAASVFLIFKISTLSTPTIQTNHTFDDYVARMTRSVNSQWNKTVELDKWMKSDRYEIIKGSSEITFDSGAVVVLAAPAQFTIINAYSMKLDYGKLKSYVPKSAIGFEITLPDMKIVDLGTEFAIDCPKDKSATEVHVINGAIELQTKFIDQIFKEGDACRVEQSKVSRIEFKNNLFDWKLPEYDNKNKFYHHWSFDHWSFSPSGSKVFQDTGNASTSYPGAQIPTRKKPIGIPGKVNSAIQFDGETHIRTTFHGALSNQARSISFWTRLPINTKLSNNNTFVTWGKRSKENKWLVGWNNIRSDGIMGALRFEFGDAYMIGSTKLNDGEWHHITVIYTGGQKKQKLSNLIRIYIDGQLENISGHLDGPIQIEEARRQNSSNLKFGVHHEDHENKLIADIDEMYFFEYALRPEEIIRLVNLSDKISSICA